MDSHLHAVSSVSTYSCVRMSSETKMNPNSQTVTKRVAGRVSRPRQHYHRNYLTIIITHIKRIRTHSNAFAYSLTSKKPPYLLKHRGAHAAPHNLTRLNTYLR